MSYKHYLIAYDICDAGRLAKVASIAASYGRRIQYSVFEAELEPIHVERLKHRIERVITDEDSVLLLVLYEKDWNKAERYGIMPRCEPSGPCVIL